MAAGAVINAAWDLRAKRAGQPLWQHLARLEPEELVSLVDFRYLTDALTLREAVEILERARPGRAEREERLLTEGYPAYTTTPGWLGYSDDKLDRLAREAVEQGFTMIKLKVGSNVADDVRRMKVARAAVGDGVRIAVDANQRWDVASAIDWMRALAPYDPYWIEEPTSPDDVLGHATIRRAIHPIKVATGEHVANRVVFKQLLQAGAVDIVQIDAARVAGVNENLAVLLLAAKHGIPVCPHAGGVGLCEMVQHLSMFDYRRVSAVRKTAVNASSWTTYTSTSSTQSTSSVGSTGLRGRPAAAVRFAQSRSPNSRFRMGRAGRSRVTSESRKRYRRSAGS